MKIIITSLLMVSAFCIGFVVAEIRTSAQAKPILRQLEDTLKSMKQTKQKCSKLFYDN